MNMEPTSWDRIIQNSRDKFRSDFDAIPDGVFSIDRSFTIRSTNKALSARIKLDPKAIVGHKCYELGLCPETKTCNQEQENKKCFAHMIFETSQIQIFTNEIKTESDAPFYMEIHAIPISGESGQCEHILIIQRNITLQEKLKKKLEHYNEELQIQVADQTQALKAAYDSLETKKVRMQKANRKLKKLEKIKQDLTNMVIHDLKGPLFEIMANMDLLKENNFSDIEREYLESAKIGAEEMFRMISNLLDITRLENKKLILHKEKTSALALLEEAAQKVKALARLKEIEVITRLLDDQPVYIVADKNLFSRVMSNLLTNAITYTPQGGSITMTARCHDASGMVLIEVADTGCGIPKELQKKIFNKFEVGQSDNPESTGLGLAFCRMAIMAHKGKIWITSAQGKGTTVSFTIPNAN
ncbi:MAG: ATP-binding protein [Pseudomonadota bacterium]